MIMPMVEEAECSRACPVEVVGGHLGEAEQLDHPEVVVELGHIVAKKS